MPKPLVNNPQDIRLAMIGMVEGNGHPYSWSAIINANYDRQRMQRCGYPVIPEYLDAQPEGALGIPGTRVTHIWCDQRRDADQVAACTGIDHILDKPEDAIGQVDAVIIPTDIGQEHVARARAFIDAGLPVFIDKPLTDNAADLKQFIAWWDQGKPMLSTSCMRYARELTSLRDRLDQVGSPRIITVSMPKSWERYGIHAIEAVYPLQAPGGWLSAQTTTDPDDGRSIVHLRHGDGVEAVVLMADDLADSFAHVTVLGSAGRLEGRFTDTFSAFKGQLLAFVDYLRTGQSPVDRAETIEQMTMVIAALRSRDEGGPRVQLSEVFR